MRRLAATTSLAMVVAAMARADGVDVAIPAEIKPLLATHCVDCHGGARAKGGLDLERALAAGACDEGMLRALRRRLARRDMPPATETERPSDAEYRAAVGAVDAVCAPSSREVPALRRLNRAQYAGAVRDVFGFDADRVRELLPRDEIGEGFDTTAATLALPPLLVEKYFDAAERVAGDCVPPATRERRQQISPEKLERNGQGGTYDGVAWLATMGALGARFDAPYAGTYRITFDACAQFAGDALPELEASVDGRRIASAAIQAAADTVQSVVIEVALDVGSHVARARFTNDFYDPKNPDPKRRDRNLGVARVLIEGPLGPAPESEFKRRAHAIAGEGADGERLRRVAATIGEECFRRPLAREEVDALAATAVAAAGTQAAFDAQLRALVTALLVDPRFLLRVEAVPTLASANGHARLSGLELASRLSFFLWSSVPDAELRRAAAAGELARPDALRAQVRRMLADPRAASLSQRFATQWLGIDGLETKQLDPALFPGVDVALLTSMRRETELLFDDVVRGARPVRALIESRSTHVDARLAAHYGLPQPSSSPA